jgi:hypothetical protein
MTLEVLLIVGLAAVAAAIFCAVFWMMSAVTGWSDLAQRFRYRGRFKGKMYRFRQYRTSRWPTLGGLNGIGTLHVGMNDEGLYLVPFITVRLFRPPLLIPWSEMEAVPEGKFFFRYKVALRSVPDMAFYFGDWFYDATGYLEGLKSPEEHFLR